MDILDSIKTLGLKALDLVFPVSCVVCGKEGEFLCRNCKNKLTPLPHQLCIVCKKPSAFGKTHADCVTRNTVDGIISALSYTDPKTKKLIGTFKYEFIHDLAPPLARMIADAIFSQGINNYFENFTVIPVPLHKRRLNWRGFNQAELLSKSLSEILGISLDDQLVVRNKFTKPQIELSAHERKSNIENAFEIKKESTSKYLLVDDVVTTGSTINELAKILKKNKAAEVWAATIAHG